MALVRGGDSKAIYLYIFVWITSVLSNSFCQGMQDDDHPAQYRYPFIKPGSPVSPPPSSAQSGGGEDYDYILVGGGTAGCPLTARNYTVLLLERGGTPFENANVSVMQNFHISLADVSQTSAWQTSATQTSAWQMLFISTDGVFNSRARVLGGGTCINASASVDIEESPKWMRKEIWDGIWDIWDTPKFKNLQNRYQQNRLSDRNGIGAALSASGSISIRQHALRMSKKNGGNLVPFQKAFKRCHRRNKGKGLFVDKKSKNALEIYTEKLKQNQSQSNGAMMLPSFKVSCIIYPEAWAEAFDGPKSGHCYGFDSSYNESSSSFVPRSSINHSQVEIANAKKIQELEKELEKQRVEMKKNIEQGIKNGTKDASSYVSRCVFGLTSFSWTFMCFNSWVLSTFSWPPSGYWSTSSFSVWRWSRSFSRPMPYSELDNSSLLSHLLS